MENYQIKNKYKNIKKFSPLPLELLSDLIKAANITNIIINNDINKKTTDELNWKEIATKFVSSSLIIYTLGGKNFRKMFMRFKKKMSLCIICNEVITGKSVLLKCRHVAHLICLTPHFLTNKVCPEDGMEVVCDIEIKLAKTCMKVKRSFSSTCADDSDESKEPKKMKSEKQKSAGKNVVTAVEQVTTVEPKNEYKHPHSIKQFIPQLFEDGENKENKQSCSGSSQTESKPVFSLQWDVKDAKRADMKVLVVGNSVLVHFLICMNETTFIVKQQYLQLLPSGSNPKSVIATHSGNFLTIFAWSL